jgi:hypothetical protein
VSRTADRSNCGESTSDPTQRFSASTSILHVLRPTAEVGKCESARRQTPDSSVTWSLRWVVSTLCSMMDLTHVAWHQRKSFEVLFPLLPPGGLYAIEDMHTAYWPTHGGGYGRRGTAIEVTKSLIDDMHHWYHGRRSAALPPGNAVRSIVLYDSMAFITKGEMRRPSFVTVGEPSL